MTDVEYLDLDDAINLIRGLGVGPIRDVGLLDSAMSRPRSSAFGEDAYPTIALKAAALFQSLANTHPLVDGNKRLAWLSVVVFCDLNGVEPHLTDGDAFQLVWDIIATDIELQEIVNRLHLVDRTPRRPKRGH